LSAGCSRPAAVINGKKISKDFFELRLKEKIQEHEMRKLTPDIKKLKDAVMQALIGEMLMIEEAERLGITISEEELNSVVESMKGNTGEDAFMKGLKEKGMTMEMFKKRTRDEMILLRFWDSFFKEIEVQEEEAREYYRNSPIPFITPGRVFMKLIEVASEETALAIQEEMEKKNISFDDMAENISADSKAVVSDYGWVNPDFFSPEISQAVKVLKVGESGGPYKGQNSYFFIRVKDKEKESVAKFEEVKDEIKAALVEQKKQARLVHWLAQKKKSATIEINIK
jgi:parvulin-like peptidyl-prolyl isomerase